MRLHERTLLVQRAEDELAVLVSEFCSKKGLTTIEAVGCLLSITQRTNKYAIRFERHGDETRKADEA